MVMEMLQQLTNNRHKATQLFLSRNVCSPLFYILQCVAPQLAKEIKSRYFINANLICLFPFQLILSQCPTLKKKRAPRHERYVLSGLIKTEGRAHGHGNLSLCA